MPLPFLLLGAAVLAGGFGAKKGWDAKKDFDRASELHEDAEEIYNEAAESLEIAREKAQKMMERLGTFKLSIYEKSIIPFVDAFSKFKNVDFTHADGLTGLSLPEVTLQDMAEVQKIALGMSQVLGGGLTALGGGGLAGLAAYGGVGLLGATASSGASIAALSGVAAQNATLAWLGGGALSAGGMGMAGGAAVLGGIVAGPVLAIGGMLLASKAEEAKHNAYANYDTACLAAEEMKAAEVVTKGIDRRFKEIFLVLHELNKRFQPLLDGLNAIAGTLSLEASSTPVRKKLWRKIVEFFSSKKNYAKMSEEDQRGIYMAAMMAKTLKTVLDAPLLDESGTLTSASLDVINTAKKNLKAIQVAA